MSVFIVLVVAVFISPVTVLARFHLKPSLVIFLRVKVTSNCHMFVSEHLMRINDCENMWDENKEIM